MAEGENIYCFLKLWFLSFLGFSSFIVVYDFFKTFPDDWIYIQLIVFTLRALAYSFCFAFLLNFVKVIFFNTAKSKLFLQVFIFLVSTAISYFLYAH